MIGGMNPYQKSAVLVIKLAAAYLALTSFVVIAIDLLERTSSTRLPPPVSYSAAPLYRNAIWVVLGLFLWLFAKPLGRWLGKGLD